MFDGKTKPVFSLYHCLIVYYFHASCDRLSASANHLLMYVAVASFINLPNITLVFVINSIELVDFLVKSTFVDCRLVNSGCRLRG